MMGERTEHVAKTRKRTAERKGKGKLLHCCARFEESVREGIFVHAPAGDETEWFMPKWLHIYYCPFCGTLVKGKGTGDFDKSRSQKRTKA